MKPIGLIVLASALAAAASNGAAPDQTATNSLFHAIRAGDLSSVSAALAAGASPNDKDQQGMPAIVYAALVADAATMRALLDKGADPNAPNPDGATALIYAAADSAKAKLLVARGAKVQVQSMAGATPLFVASSADGNADVVRLLLAKGARVDVQDRVQGMPAVMSGGGKTPPLVAAARLRNPETLRLLLAAGANLNATDANGATALSDAVLYDNAENVSLLLAAGATVNFPVGGWKQTPLMAAAMHGNPTVVGLLLAAGADVKPRDASGSTALMWASYSEHGDAAAVNALLAAGADVHPANQWGETALTWAKRRGETAVVAALQKAGARENGPATEAVTLRPTSTTDLPTIRAAVEKTLPPLQALGAPSFKKTGCISCHNNLLPMMAAASARDLGFQYDADQLTRNTKLVAAFVSPAAGPMREGLDLIPDIPITGGYVALALHAAGTAPNAVTDALVHRIAQAQNQDGHWAVWAPRPPIESSSITATALALRALALYGPQGRHAEFEQRVERAGQWLDAANPQTGEDRTMRLLGLTWAHAKPAAIQSAIAAIVAAQREDGGWAQLDTLQSDAYATGEALYALHEAGQDTGAGVYRRGVAWLRSTQEADGSWHVKSRAFPFQPLVDTDYGYGRDQWISSQASSWAVMALTFAKEEPSSLAGASAAGR